MVDISEYTRGGIQEKTVQFFLNSRKNEKTRSYTLEIIKCLSDRFDKDFQQSGDFDTAGWVRTKDLIEHVKTIPNESTFHQLLKNLVEAKVIEKKSEYSPRRVIGKKPVYYRVPHTYTQEVLRTFQTKESLLHDLNEAYHQIENIELKLAAAKNLLRRCHEKGYDPEREIQQELLTIPSGDEFWYVQRSEH